MNINLIKLAGVVKALNRIAVAIERHNELQEMELQDKGFTTRVFDTPDRELKDTQVEYPDPMIEVMVQRLESEGHTVTEKDREMIIQELSKDDEA